jgi:hypothetical protein
MGSAIAQADCTSPVVVADLTGGTCATASPSNTSWLAAGSCEEGANDTWFSFVAQGPTATVNVSSSSNGFRPEIIVISSSDNTCTGALTEEDCTDQNGNYTAISTNLTGLTIGDTYWIVVSSNGNSTSGTTSVCVTNPVPSAGCIDNEDCANAETLVLNASGGGLSCDTDCNTGASSGNTYLAGGCSDQPNATVWYEITTDANAATLDINVSSPDLANPEFTIIQGNACLSPWTIIACAEGAGNAGSVTLIGTAINPNTTYMIAVSDINGDEGDFTLCVQQEPDNSACNTNNSLDVTATSMGSPFGGPYQQGEDVTFCYTLTDWQQVNCNYVGAFVPTFGNGWLPSSFNAQGMPNIIVTPLATVGQIQPGPGNPWHACRNTPSGAWSWFPAGSVTYNINGYYNANDPMPAGWYFLSSYSPLTGACFGDPTDPDDTYGDGNFPDCGTNTFDYLVCFTLRAGEQAECDAGTTDLTVSMKTFGDGEFGAWNSIACTADATTTQATSIDCVVLPIELLSFEGQYNQKKTFLNWKTGSEDNVSHFIISYRSSFTDELTQIGEVKAKGFSNVELDYEFIHETPHPGTSYYNLKAVDFDGKIQDHGFIPVTANYEFISYRADLKQIQMNYEGDIEIYSMDGSLVKKSSGKLFVDFDLKGIFLVKDIKRGIFQKIVTH